MKLYFQNQTQQCGNVIFHSFDPVTVRLSLDSTNVQHEKLVFQLVKPFIEGFSIGADETQAMEVQQIGNVSSKKKAEGSLEQSSKKKKKKS